MKTYAWIRIAQASVLLGCAVVGCSGSGSSGGGTASPITAQDFLQAWAQAICKNIAGCCQTSGYPYDASACESALVSEFPAPPGAKYDAQAASACVQEAASLASGCHSWVDPTRKALNAACDPVFTGSLQLGQPCNNDVQCASGPNGEHRLCTYSKSTASQVCTAITRGKAGDACTETCTELADGQFDCSDLQGGAVTACFTNDGLHCSSTGTCAAQLSVGQSCTSSFDCKSGTHCDLMSGQCAAQLPLGGACFEDKDCVAGAFCNMTTSQCEAQRSDGASCTTSNQCKSDQCVQSGTQAVCSSSLASPDLCAGKLTSSSSSSAGP